MGAASPYKAYKTTVLRDDRWKTFLARYEIKDSHASKFWNPFHRMDRKSIGEVTFKSFCDTWKVKPGGRGLVRRYFTLVDNERSEFGEDSLYFQESAVMVYELCTTPMDDLVRWTFQTFDHDRSGAISTDEFKELCKLCRGEEAGTPGTRPYKDTLNLLKELDKDFSGEISFGEFKTDAPRLCPGLFAPLVELQASFRKEILGEVWWVGADAKREKANKAGRSPIEVYRKGGKFIRKSRRRKKAKVTNVAKTIKLCICVEHNCWEQRKDATSRSASVAPRSNSAVMSELMNKNGNGFKGKSTSIAPAP